MRYSAGGVTREEGLEQMPPSPGAAGEGVQNGLAKNIL